MRTLRLRGLVRLTNEVRARLAFGVTPEELARLRRSVRRALEQADRAAREQGLPAGRLATPSRRAYRYLKSLDLERWDRPPPAEGHHPATIRVANLVAGRNWVMGELDRLARLGTPGGYGLGEGLDRLHGQILDVVAETAVLIYRAGAVPGALPDPSRRAYQWLSFLSDRTRLEEHLDTMIRARALDPRVVADLSHFAGLFRTWWSDGIYRVTLSEPFCGAPDEVLRAAARVARPNGHRNGYRELLHEYSETARFQELSRALEAAGGAWQERSRGQYYDLEEIFREVNENYLEGRVPQPRLRWSRVLAHREVGHYERSTDTVMISAALDSPQVPRHVVEHVMHHELLHKLMGALVVHGRRIYHSPDFREEERKYPYYQEAEAFLRRVGSVR